MLKVYKILLITYFPIITGSASLVASALSVPPELTLVIKHSKATINTQSKKISFAEHSYASYKITQTTKKITTALVRKEADLLVHFTEPINQVIVRVSDIQGKVISATHHPAMEAGFYEIPVLPSIGKSSLYFVSLIINQQTYSFQVSSQP